MAKNQPTPPTSDDVAGSALFRKFLQTAEGYIRQPTRLKQLLTDAYKKASEKNDVGTLAQEAWDTLQTMFRLIKASVSGEYTGVPGTTVAAAVAVLIYFLSPIDLIPDFIPVLGLLDDVALVAWFSTTLKGEMDKFQEWELTRPTVTSVAVAAETGAADTPVSAVVASEPAAAPAAAATVAPAAPAAQPSFQSAKYAGTTDAPASNTDAGLGSPDSSSPRPVHEAGPDVTPSVGTNSYPDALANTADGSRDGNNGAVDTGGNVR